jgi:tetratricopeptide (TPR) repeat protein
MSLLGSGLSEAARHEDAVSVLEASLSMKRRLGASEYELLVVQSNLGNTYHSLGRLEEANRMLRDVYSGQMKLTGEEHPRTLVAALNYAVSLKNLDRFKEARALMRKTVPLARRVRGEGSDLTLSLRANYAVALYEDPASTLTDLREAETTLEEAARIARRVFGGAHPLTVDIERHLPASRAALAARDMD